MEAVFSCSFSVSFRFIWRVVWLFRFSSPEKNVFLTLWTGLDFSVVRALENMEGEGATLMSKLTL